MSQLLTENRLNKIINNIIRNVFTESCSPVSR